GRRHPPVSDTLAVGSRLALCARDVRTCYVARAMSEAAALEALRCGNCDGAVPLGDGDAIKCPYCAAVVAIPGRHRARRDAQRVGASGRRRLVERGKLQAELAAKPPSRPGGPARCRRCDAPLDVKPGDLGVRCFYCRTDNLVAMPADWIARMKSGTAEIAREI